MTIHMLTSETLDYDRCRYGTSRLAFRGPYRMPQALGAAVLGGTEVFGKFVAEPFPLLLERHLGRPVCNLGVVNAGIDTFLGDPVVAEVCARARVAVVQVMPAQNLSNRYYSVHPRRNDRFLRPGTALCQLFPEVDFADCAFTGHLLARLRATCPLRYSDVVAELRRRWVMRMTELISALGMPCVLLWLGEGEPGSAAELAPGVAGLITEEMLAQIGAMTDGVVRARVDHQPGDHESMVFAEFERPQALAVPGPGAHAAAAEKLATAIGPLLTAC